MFCLVDIFNLQAGKSNIPGALSMSAPILQLHNLCTHVESAKT